MKYLMDALDQSLDESVDELPWMGDRLLNLTFLHGEDTAIEVLKLELKALILTKMAEKRRCEPDWPALDRMAQRAQRELDRRLEQLRAAEDEMLKQAKAEQQP